MVPRRSQALDDILRCPHNIDRDLAAMVGETYGYCTLTGPAKRNFNMRCIIQAFLLSIAPVHWLLEDEREPIRSLFAFCSRAGKRIH